MSSSDPWVDKLTIETPEQTPLEYPLAGIGSRFLAMALDTLIQSAAAILVILIFVFLALPLGMWVNTAPIWAMAILILFGFLLQFGYFMLFEAIWNGQTPGKRVTRLRVIQDSGRPITVYQAISRNLMRIVDSLPTMYVTGIISMLVTRQNKRLGDLVAGTVVVHEKPFEQVQLARETPAQTAGRRYDVARLTSEELQLIESFLQRRNYLSPDVRNAMAGQIADRLAEKLALASTERPGPEAFLEELARERRALAGFG